MLYTPYQFIFNLHLEVSANQHTIYPPIRPQSKLFFRSDLTLSHIHRVERASEREHERKRERAREREREKSKMATTITQTV